MAINSLYPAFVQIRYRSAWGVHVQTIPTRAWNAFGGTNGFGGYENWNSVGVDAKDMVDALVDAIAVIADADIVWVNTIIYIMSAPDANPVPVKIIPMAQVGAVTHTDSAIALQQTYTAFDDSFNTAKLVLLDMDATMNLVPKAYGDLNANHKAVVDTWFDLDWAWSSRGGHQLQALRTVISKPNDKLRKEYGLS